MLAFYAYCLIIAPHCGSPRPALRLWSLFWVFFRSFFLIFRFWNSDTGFCVYYILQCLGLGFGAPLMAYYTLLSDMGYWLGVSKYASEAPVDHSFLIVSCLSFYFFPLAMFRSHALWLVLLWRLQPRGRSRLRLQALQSVCHSCILANFTWKSALICLDKVAQPKCSKACTKGRTSQLKWCMLWS